MSKEMEWMPTPNNAGMAERRGTDSGMPTIEEAGSTPAIRPTDALYVGDELDALAEEVNAEMYGNEGMDIVRTQVVSDALRKATLTTEAKLEHLKAKVGSLTRSLDAALEDLDTANGRIGSLGGHIMELRLALRKKQEFLHNAQSHQWTDFAKCDHKECVAVRTLTEK